MSCTRAIALCIVLCIAASGRAASADCSKLEGIERVDCEEKAGRLAVAWTELQALIASGKGDDKALRERSDKLDERVSRVIVHKDPAFASLTVKLDGKDITDKLDQPIRVDQGKHALVVDIGGAPIEQTLKVDTEGSELEVTVPPKGTQLPSVTKPEAPVTPHDDPNQPRKTRRLIALATGGAGVVLAGVGFGFGASARGKWNDSKPHCDADRRCDSQGEQLIDAAKSSALKADIFVGIGAAALIAGGILWFTAPARVEPSVTVSAELVGGAVSVRF